jgi:glycosyltransferase involved in cell wall biosynthesis
MRILAVTNMYPMPHNPVLGTFIEQQINGLRQIGLEVEVMVVDRFTKGMSVYLTLKKLLAQRVLDFQPDIVHAMYGGILADVVTRHVHDRPTVVSFCGSDLLGELLSGIFRRVVSGYGVLASHRSAKRACGIIVKSKNLRDALPSSVSTSKIRIIPNGVNLDLFKPLARDSCRARLGWENDRLHVLFPTNCGGDPRKRLNLAIAAVEVANRSGIKAELHQLQKVPHHEVPLWLNASDVVLLTSLHEGSPNIIKEALACDLPVVSVDVGDVQERIQGIEGCHLALPDPQDLAARLSMVLAGPSRVKGREKMQELSLDRVALSLKEFYEDLLLSYGRIA